VDGKVVFKARFRIINAPPIYALSSTTGAEYLVTPGNTDYDDLISTSIPQSYVGKTAYSPMVTLVKQYILNALGVTGN